MKSNIRWRIAQYAELRWWKQYLKGKEIEEYLNWKKGYWRQLFSKVQDVVELSTSASIMDAACGPAGIFMILQDYKVTALDPLLNRYEEELAHFEKDGFPHVTFIPESLEDYRANSKFEAVFCLNGINHVSNINASFKTLSYMTMRGGYLIMTVDAHKYSFVKQIFSLLPGDILHPQQFNLADYHHFIQKHGFDLVHTECTEKGRLFDHYLIIARK